MSRSPRALRLRYKGARTGRRDKRSDDMKYMLLIYDNAQTRETFFGERARV